MIDKLRRDPNVLLRQLRKNLDTSEMSIGHPYFQSSNPEMRKELLELREKNRGGKLKFKNDSKDKMLLSVCAIKSKLYIKLYSDYSLVKKIKGVPFSARDKLTFDHYLDCIFDGKTINLDINCFSSEKFQIFLKKIQKVALTSFDSKRFMVNRFFSVPFGDCRIPKFLNDMKKNQKIELFENEIFGIPPDLISNPNIGFSSADFEDKNFDNGLNKETVLYNDITRKFILPNTIEDQYNSNNIPYLLQY